MGCLSNVRLADCIHHDGSWANFPTPHLSRAHVSERFSDATRISRHGSRFATKILQFRGVTILSSISQASQRERSTRLATLSWPKALLAGFQTRGPPAVPR